MAIEVETPEGIVEFPDGTPPETIRTAMRKLYAQQRVASMPQLDANPTSGMSATQRFLAGVGKGMTDIARGAGQVLGVVDEQSIADARKRDEALMQSGAGVAGSIVGGTAALLPTMLVPGAASIPGAIAAGAISGALTPTVDGESRAANMALGGAAGAGGQMAARGLSRVLSPQTAPAVRELIDSGVTPTPGQTLGGVAKRVESALESVPVVGQGIKNAKTRAIEDFNRTVLNRALAPIGQKVTAIGHEGIEQAMELGGKAYDDALSLLPRVDFDPQFDNALANIRQMASTLKPDSQKQVEKIIQERVLDKLTPAKTLSGESFKAIESDLKGLARGLRSSSVFDDRQAGDALNAVVGELRDLAARNSPEAAAALKKADEAWAMLIRAQTAAAKTGAPEGVFTPAQFGSAVRSLDKSLRKGASAKGQALMQDLSTAGRTVLGDTLPNSGTADRLMTPLLLGGGYMVEPTLALGALGARAAYTEPGQKVISSLLTQRPQMARAAGALVERSAPLAGLAGIQAALGE